jgi:hypothetical protein
MLAAQFIRPENQTIIWNVISQMDVFRQIQSQEHRVAFFQNCIGQTYDDLMLKQIPYSKPALQEANRFTLQQMVSELKPKPNPKPNGAKHADFGATLPPKKAVKQSIDDMYAQRKNEYEAANARPTMPENPFELPKDEPITNMEELIEQHKNGTFVSAFDAARMTTNPMMTHKTQDEQTQVILDIQRQLGELRDEIAQLKKLVGGK